jgi:hypothetical protein
MAGIRVTNQLRGDLGELYFKHLCQQRGYAYARLEEIYQRFSPKGIIVFKMGFDRIAVAIPEEVIDEIWRVCRPTLIGGNPSFVFDFLTCSVGDGYDVSDINELPVSAFNWVEIKTGGGQLSMHQGKVARDCKIPVSVFRVKNVDVNPHRVDIVWE